MSTKAITAKQVQVNVQDAKTHLSRYLDEVEEGSTVVLCRHNKPIAEIRRLEPLDTEKPEFGLYDGLGVPQSFFEPLPGNVVKGFSGL